MLLRESYHQSRRAVNCLFIYLFICLSFICLFVCLFVIYLFCLFICVFVCSFVHLFISFMATALMNMKQNCQTYIFTSRISCLLVKYFIMCQMLAGSCESDLCKDLSRTSAVILLAVDQQEGHSTS